MRDFKATPHNGTRKFGEGFWPRRRFWKCGNTFCISHFQNCTDESKGPLFSRRRMIQRFLRYPEINRLSAGRCAHIFLIVLPYQRKPEQNSWAGNRFPSERLSTMGLSSHRTCTHRAHQKNRDAPRKSIPVLSIFRWIDSAVWIAVHKGRGYIWRPLKTTFWWFGREILF